MICAVVVTYNRKQMLVECVEALLNQTIQPDKILVLDNASTDGTKDLLEEKNLFDKVVYKRLKNNMTAAGGFYWGMKQAYNLGADYLWIMDDDVAPKEDALEAFINDAKVLNNEFSFLASAVYGYDNVPMNVPTIDTNPSKNGYADWYKYLNSTMVRIEIATYVSLFITRDTIANVGLPYWRMNQWGCDSEHTKRMSLYKPAYFCGNSAVLHKRKNSSNLSPLTEMDKARLRLYSSYYESHLVLYKYYYGRKTLLKYKTHLFLEIFKALKKKYRFRRINNIFKGYFRYLFGFYKKKEFKNRYNNLNENYKGFIEE